MLNGLCGGHFLFKDSTTMNPTREANKKKKSWQNQFRRGRVGMPFVIWLSYFKYWGLDWC
jgi:hypothetical protein